MKFPTSSEMNYLLSSVLSTFSFAKSTAQLQTASSYKLTMVGKLPLPWSNYSLHQAAAAGHHPRTKASILNKLLTGVIPLDEKRAHTCLAPAGQCELLHTQVPEASGTADLGSCCSVAPLMCNICKPLPCHNEQFPVYLLALAGHLISSGVLQRVLPV